VRKLTPEQIAWNELINKEYKVQLKLNAKKKDKTSLQ
jgi:hypothetical protein